MTFNMEYGGTVISFHSIVEGVQVADADVIGLEEAFGNVDRLAKAVDYPYYNERLQVISRYPLIDPPGADGLYLLVQIAPGQVVAIGNVHLPSGPYSPNLTRRGAPRSQILEIERRVRVPAVTPSVLALSALAAQDIPVFLVGDFNAPSLHDWTPETVGLRPQITYPVHWPVSAFVESSGFVDSWREAHPDPVTDPGLTWPSERPDTDEGWNPGPNAPQDRIDYVYASGPAQTLQSELMGEAGGLGVTLSVDPWGTDHRAVVSTFSVTPGVPPTFVAVGSRLVGVGDDQQVTFHATGGAGRARGGDPGGRRPGGAALRGLHRRRHRRHDRGAHRRLGRRNLRRALAGRRPGTFAHPVLGQPAGRQAAGAPVQACVRDRRVDPCVVGQRARRAMGLDRRVRARGRSERRLVPHVVLHAGVDPRHGRAGRGLRGSMAPPAGKYSVYLLADDGYRILARSWFTVRD